MRDKYKKPQKAKKIRVQMDGKVEMKALKIR